MTNLVKKKMVTHLKKFKKKNKPGHIYLYELYYKIENKNRPI